ncbi:MAG: sulfite exporter TauE/SafE family protein [Pseudohongiellaceae bacterium]
MTEIVLIEIAIATVVIFAGSFVQSSIGFGLAIIAAPVLFLLDPVYVPGPITVAALTLSLANAWSHRRAISFHGLKFALLGRVPGTVFGGLLLLWFDQRALALWLGVSVLVAVGLSLRKFVLQPTATAMTFAGFLSGFMGTSTSIGGPPLALVLQHQPGDYIRANMAAFFTVSCVLSLMMLTAVGHFGPAQMLASAPLLPATLAGYWLAMKNLHRVSYRALRTSSLFLCVVAGSLAILSYWR